LVARLVRVGFAGDAVASASTSRSWSVKEEKGLLTPGGDRKIGRQKSRLRLNSSRNSRGRRWMILVWLAWCRGAGLGTGRTFSFTRLRPPCQPGSLPTATMTGY